MLHLCLTLDFSLDTVLRSSVISNIVSLERVEATARQDPNQEHSSFCKDFHYVDFEFLKLLIFLPNFFSWERFWEKPWSSSSAVFPPFFFPQKPFSLEIAYFHLNLSLKLWKLSFKLVSWPSLFISSPSLSPIPASSSSSSSFFPVYHYLYLHTMENLIELLWSWREEILIQIWSHVKN